MSRGGRAFATRGVDEPLGDELSRFGAVAGRFCGANAELSHHARHARGASCPRGRENCRARSAAPAPGRPQPGRSHSAALPPARRRPARQACRAARRARRGLPGGDGPCATCGRGISAGEKHLGVARALRCLRRPALRDRGHRGHLGARLGPHGDAAAEAERRGRLPRRDEISRAARPSRFFGRSHGDAGIAAHRAPDRLVSQDRRILAVMRLAVPIEERLRDADTPEPLRAKLAKVLAIREFASRELALPDNGSYRRYADIGRPFVVWNVFAAPEFSVKPLESCFLFAGCVSYRGFYSEEAAQRHAASLAEQGHDVYVGGVAAYSTLGWFSDPVLSTFIQYPEPEVARIVFHELAHQLVYVKGDTMFNESFAATVEEEGVRRWLEREGTPAQRAAYEDSRRRRSEFVALVMKYRAELAAFYDRPAEPEEKSAGKRRLFSAMQDEYLALKRSWGGFTGYDRLFARGANNALLASVASYSELVPAFRALLVQNNGDLPVFYAAVRELANLDKSERDARLAVPGR